MWKQHGLEDLMVNTEGFFYFRFSTFQGMMEVIENGQWLMNDILIFVRRWKPGLVLPKPKLESVLVWVKNL